MKLLAHLLQENFHARSSRPKTILLSFACSFLLASTPVSAHTIGEGYLMLEIGESELTGSVELTLVDLDLELGLDIDNDGKVSDSELEKRFDEIPGYVLARVGIGADGQWFPISFKGQRVRNLPKGRFVQVYFNVDSPDPVPDLLDINYDLLFDADSKHRGFLVVTENAKTGVVNKGEKTTLRFDPDSRTQTLNINELSSWTTFVTFVKHGIWHIWIGIDHILFLLALILPAVLVRRDGQWQGVNNFTPALWQVIKIVTLFTVAHTITLTIAAIGVISIPSRIVESVIAASVVIAALNNVYPLLRQHLGIVVFGFGLFHGFGFASVLSHLITNRSNLVVDLLGFNVGVEIGQIAIILVAFPALFAMRHSVGYLRVLVPVGSMAIAALAAGWLLERALELSFMPI
jgi:hypothetical protein